MEAQILLYIQENLRNPILDPIMTFITHLGDAGIIWIITTIILLCFKKTRKIGLCCVFALLLQITLINGLIKNIVGRPRPYTMIDGLICMIGEQFDPSFPSGHTTISFACAYIWLRKLPKKFGIPAVILACLIAFSRLYVGVHYPTDVLAGIVFGILLGVLAIWITDKLCNWLAGRKEKRKTA